MNRQVSPILTVFVIGKVSAEPMTITGLWEGWEKGAIVNYERVVIGNGRDAVQSAVAAARMGLRVGLVNPFTADLHSESCVLRRAVERLDPLAVVSMTALRAAVARLVEEQQSDDAAELRRLGVDVMSGSLRFVDGTTVAFGTGEGGELLLTARSFVVACGSTSLMPGQVTRDGRSILAAEDLLLLDELPRSMLVVGAGRTGLDHAIVLAKLGVEVTVVDEHSSQFHLCSGLMDVSLFEAQSLDIVFRLGDEVIGMQKRPRDTTVDVRLASGRVLTADAVLVCTGRQGRTEGLDLESAGVGLDEHGRVWCDANGRTWNPNIAAVGDVVGFRATSAIAV
jgi:pyruvate/2-oxoglutarate dehydrogenase complex dihydrolipoamide dehydrogenase (E3) component